MILQIFGQCLFFARFNFNAFYLLLFHKRDIFFYLLIEFFSRVKRMPKSLFFFQTPIQPVKYV